MKKRFFSLFLCAALLLSILFSAHTAWADTSSDGGSTYTDPDTGLTFVVPDGWNEQELDAEASKFLQVQFVSQQGAGSTILYGSVDLWNAATASERSGHTRSDFNSHYIYTLDDGAVVAYWAERMVQGAAEVQTNASVNDIQLVTYGKNEFIEYSVMQEVSSIRFPLTVVFLVENGYMHIFMFSAFGGTRGEATQDFHAILSSLQDFTTGRSNLPDSGSLPAGGNIYTDPDTGATFVVPEGWNEAALDVENAGIYQVEFDSQNYPGSNFMYGSADLWSMMTASERSGHTRSDIDSAYIYAYNEGAFIENMGKGMVQSAADVGIETSLDDIKLVTYGKNEMIEFSTSQEISGARFPVTAIWFVEDGYIYAFMFASNNNQATRDFRSVPSSLQTPTAEAPGSGGTGSGQADEVTKKIMEYLVNFLLFLVELGVTFLIYALPFVVYRNAIRKRPVNEKALVLILVVLYEFVAWLLLNGALSWFLRRYANILIPFIWGWYSYRKMVRGKDTDDLPAGADGSAAPQQPVKADTPLSAAYTHQKAVSAASVPPFNADAPAAQQPAASDPAAYAPVPPVPPAPQTAPLAPRVQFCRNCGFRLLEDSKFCSCCGTPVVPIAKE